MSVGEDLGLWGKYRRCAYAVKTKNLLTSFSPLLCPGFQKHPGLPPLPPSSEVPHTDVLVLPAVFHGPTHSLTYAPKPEEAPPEHTMTSQAMYVQRDVFYMHQQS